MSEKTINLELNLANSSEAEKLVADWIDELTGTNSNSNMQKIDAAYGEIDTTLSSHTGNSNIHITSEEKSKWTNKANLVRGYFLDGGFYNDALKSEEITPSELDVYLDLNTKTLYMWDSTEGEYFPVSSNQPEDTTIDGGTWG